MSKRSLGALIVLNLALLAGLAVVSAPTPAQAQLGARSNYVMIAGQTPQRNSQSAVYIIDTSTQRMIAIFFNSANNTLEKVAERNIRKDLGG